MSKNKKVISIEQKMANFEKEVMSKVTSGQITMKPKWYFVLGSVFSIAGLAALSVASVFLVNVMMFSLRRHGPMGQWKLEAMLGSFPIWIPILAISGVTLGIWLLKKYDFSYKKNFLVITVGFIASIIVAGFIIDQLGLNDIWSKRGTMRKFYQGIENQGNIIPNGPGKGNVQNGRNKRQRGYIDCQPDLSLELQLSITV
ncbi:MAG: hypothetical protein UT89_C0009G0010 [Parcubacteria group bacterium GW2011_GWE1_40_20]|nr:MAG: hypothetical protein UT89_C0009G0010 [Parcubacteria group bacterium GW2011_GWE1_40_20]